MKESIKCKCSLNNRIFCPKCSKVRMVILLKNGNEHLKTNGHNPVWYSILKYNRHDVYRIAEKMERNFKNTPLAAETNVLQFYINGNRGHYVKKTIL